MITGAGLLAVRGMSSNDPSSPPNGDNKQASPSQNSNQSPVSKKPSVYKLSIKGVRTTHTILPNFGRGRRGKITPITVKKSKKIEIKVEDGNTSTAAHQAPKEESKVKEERASEQQAANDAMAVIQLQTRMLIPHKELDVTLDNFPYYLSPSLKEMVVSTAALYLSKTQPIPLTHRNWGFLLEGPKGTDLYQESLAKAVANYFQANFVTVNPNVQFNMTQLLHAIYSRNGSHKTVLYLNDALNVNYGEQLSLLLNNQAPGHTFLLIGSSIARKGATLPPEMVKMLQEQFKVEIKKVDPVESDTRKFLASTISVHPPTDIDQLGVWQRQLHRDTEAMTFKSNLVMLHTAMLQNNIVCEGDIMDTFIKQHSLLKKQVEDVLRWAVGYSQLTTRSPHIETLSTAEGAPLNKGGAPIVLLPEHFTYAFNLLKGMKKQEHSNPLMVEDRYKIEVDDPFEKRLLSQVVIPEHMDVTFDTIGALEPVKENLQNLVIAPLRYPHLFSKGMLAKGISGILLFGPPGTGKTMLAKALARESKAAFINLSMGTLSSKWYGETEKALNALFSLAKKLSPVIIFIDEIDGFLGARGEEHEVTRRVKNDFLACWDGLKSTDPRSRRILILGATNRPFDLDEAALRRLPRRILVDLPTESDRAAILRVLLKDETLEAGVNADAIAKITTGYTGSDLKNLCLSACHHVVKQHIQAMHNAVPALAAHSMGSDELTEVEIPPEYKSMRAITMDDFLKAKQEIQLSVSEQSQTIKELRKWNQIYGSGTAKSKPSIGF